MPTDSPHIIALDDSHLQGALALSQEAGWNQTAEDWRMMLAAGSGIGFQAPDGTLTASAMTLPYGDTFGWISMVLVTAGWRKRRLATALLGRAIEMLADAGLIPVLDATPVGEKIYRPLGFVPHFPFQRWETDDVSEICLPGSAKFSCRPLVSGDVDAVNSEDREIFGGDRAAILENLAARSGGHAWTAGKEGYLLSRDGRDCRQIGPVSADDPMVAIGLLNRALSGLRGPVIIDACTHQQQFTAHLKRLGFRPQRSFLRMAMHRLHPFGDPDRMFALAGPELG